MQVFKFALQFFLLLTASVSADTFTNPLKKSGGADPFMVYADGYYYLTTTAGTNIQLTRAKTLEGLKTGETKKVWTDTEASRCCNMWAPEIHQIDGTWYIFYTAGTKNDINNQKPHVIKGGKNPWTDYTYLAQLTPEWGIDGTVLKLKSKNYFVWCCQEKKLQSLCIATLDSPSKVGKRHLLSQPKEDWETVKRPVNEAPAALYHGGRTWLAYSASHCGTANYSLGLLTYNGNGDPLDLGSWKKSQGPVFTSANGNYGTGHNGFFNSPDGKQVWNVFHAGANPAGVCDQTRYTMATEVNWNSNDTPNFGSAPPLDKVLQGPSGESK